MKKFLEWIVERLSERSTWIGIIGVVGSLGVAVSPEQADAIATAGIAVVGAILAFTKG